MPWNRSCQCASGMPLSWRARDRIGKLLTDPSDVRFLRLVRSDVREGIHVGLKRRVLIDPSVCGQQPQNPMCDRNGPVLSSEHVLPALLRNRAMPLKARHVFDDVFTIPETHVITVPVTLSDLVVTSAIRFLPSGAWSCQD